MGKGYRQSCGEGKYLSKNSWILHDETVSLFPALQNEGTLALKPDFIMILVARTVESLPWERLIIGEPFAVRSSGYVDEGDVYPGKGGLRT
ncbi:hypothetical protein SPIRO4BDMA_30010 [uncultured spirochete]|jgi:hypothetical protein|uniref:Uncharacterized protein n=1 Tax=uncultured spirochete TaxID=156406 RepID=A0A3P3XN76_9SPIR|nr:hypothetical protein SPIRO4BDMA_30010 [uncultured spirochete]